MRIALVQQTMLQTPDDNLNQVVALIHHVAVKESCDLIAFPELSCHGFNPQIQASLTEAFCDQASAKVAAMCAANRISAMVGIAHFDASSQLPQNAYLLFDQNGAIQHHWEKQVLHGDESIIFSDGHDMGPIDIEGLTIDCLLCHELWHRDFAEKAKRLNTNYLIVPGMVSAETHQGASEYANKNNCGVALVNWSNHTFFPGRAFGRSILAMGNQAGQPAPAGLQCYCLHDTALPDAPLIWTPC